MGTPKGPNGMVRELSGRGKRDSVEDCIALESWSTGLSGVYVRCAPLLVNKLAELFSDHERPAVDAKKLRCCDHAPDSTERMANMMARAPT